MAKPTTTSEGALEKREEEETSKSAWKYSENFFPRKSGPRGARRTLLTCSQKEASCNNAVV